MSDVYYPPIDEKNFLLIYQLYEQNEEFLDSEKCPYSKEFKDCIRNLSDFDDIADDLVGEDFILTEINTLYAHLKTFGETMRTSDTSSEKNTYFKLSTTLLEKLLGMKERVTNIKKMELFSSTVLQIMDEELTVDDRSRIIDRLRETLND